MLEFKDPAIKLFGKTIPLSSSHEVSGDGEPSTAASVVDSDAGEGSSDHKLRRLSYSSSNIDLHEDDSAGERDDEPEREEEKVRCQNEFFFESLFFGELSF